MCSNTISSYYVINIEPACVAIMRHLRGASKNTMTLETQSANATRKASVWIEFPTDSTLSLLCVGVFICLGRCMCEYEWKLLKVKTLVCSLFLCLSLPYLSFTVKNLDICVLCNTDLHVWLLFIAFATQECFQNVFSLPRCELY